MVVGQWVDLLFEDAEVLDAAVFVYTVEEGKSYQAMDGTIPFEVIEELQVMITTE